MTKSTPLSELPKMGNTDVAQNRQNQVPSLPLPVNTSLGNDINEDNDETIMEALSQLPGSRNNDINQTNAPPQMAMPMRPMNGTHGTHGTHGTQDQMPIVPPSLRPQIQSQQSSHPQMQSQPQIQSPQIQSPQISLNQAHVADRPSSVMDNIPSSNRMEQERFQNREYDDVESHYEDDVNQPKQNILKRGFRDVMNKNSEIKRMIIVMIVFIVMTFIPIELVAAKYIALDKFPYASIVIKAIFAGVFYYAIIKLL